MTFVVCYATQTRCAPSRRQFSWRSFNLVDYLLRSRHTSQMKTTNGNRYRRVSAIARALGIGSFACARTQKIAKAKQKKYL